MTERIGRHRLQLFDKQHWEQRCNPKGLGYFCCQWHWYKLNQSCTLFKILSQSSIHAPLTGEIWNSTTSVSAALALCDAFLASLGLLQWYLLCKWAPLCKRKSANIRCLSHMAYQGGNSTHESSYPVELLNLSYESVAGLGDLVIDFEFGWDITNGFLLMFVPYKPQWFRGWNDHPQVVCVIVMFSWLHSTRKTEHIMNISRSFLRNLGLRMPCCCCCCCWTYGHSTTWGVTSSDTVPHAHARMPAACAQGAKCLWIVWNLGWTSENHLNGSNRF